VSGTLDNSGPAIPETASRLLPWSRRFFDVTEGAFDAARYDTAAKNLRRYRSGRGGVEEYSDEEIARHPALLDAEDENRTRFESFTFTGLTGKPALNARLRDLPDGQSHDFYDEWDIGVPASRPSTYLAFGKTSVTSDGEFTAHRRGDALTIRGTVAHGFGQKEVFDFEADQPGSHPAAVLEGAGEAAPFRMAYDRRQSVEAELRYEPDGSLTLRRATWGSIR
jgi:hypothetical protein